jgi:hypothetical protein
VGEKVGRWGRREEVADMEWVEILVKEGKMWVEGVRCGWRGLDVGGGG